ncbi:Hsp70 family protein [Dactylosporangium sp. CA-092794]|uniref:Hsp70 family protein n=1 Tax=Dactylosporangium sp. CA-092794 TaxID=3239929 RepID=UPI003D8E1D91
MHGEVVVVSPAPGGYVVGIDLGTSNTVAVIRSPDGRRRPVLFDGAPLMPSSVFLQDNGQLAVGRDAQRLAQLDPGRYEPNPKRRIDEPAVLLGNTEVPTVHLLATVLRAVARGVSEITRIAPPIVLTYPASWGQTRRKLLYDAAVAAGWPQISMIPEPVAAARYFISALNHPLPRGAAMVVYDFGGGTIDIAVVRNDPQGFTVVGSGGLEDVGGLDLDAALVERLGEVLRTAEPAVWRRLQDPQTSQDRRDRRLFWEDVRGAKEMLSRTTVAPVAVPGVEAALHLTREELESQIGPMIARTVAETARVVRGCGLQPGQLAGILLVGGSSRVPLVARMLHRELQVVPTVLEQPELPVAEGAVVHPAELTTDGRFGVATGSASVGRPSSPVSAPPSGAGDMTGVEAAYPVSGIPVSSMPSPVSAVPVSGGPRSVAPVSAAPALSAAPVSPATSSPAPVGYASSAAPATIAEPETPPTPVRRRRGLIIAAVVAVAVLAAGGAWALQSFNGGAGGDGPSTPVSPIGKWEALPSVPTELDGDPVAFEGAGAAVVRNKLYVIGGWTAEGLRPKLNSVWIYDLSQGAGGKWEHGPSLTEPLSHMSVVVDGTNKIYVIGGWNASGATDEVWTLSPDKPDAWQPGPKLPQPRNSGAAAFDGTHIVFAGGTKPGEGNVPADDIWELGATGWNPIGTLSVARAKLAAATDVAGTTWFIGGAGQDTIDIVAHDKLQPNPGLKLDHPREGPSAFNIGGLGLCVLGGHDGGDFYDWWCEDGSQTPKLPKQPQPRAGMAVAVSNTTIYTIGGYYPRTNGSNTVEAFKFTSG